jgi:hypothetical protein
LSSISLREGIEAFEERPLDCGAFEIPSPEL